MQANHGGEGVEYLIKIEVSVSTGQDGKLRPTLLLRLLFSCRYTLYVDEH